MKTKYALIALAAVTTLAAAPAFAFDFCADCDTATATVKDIQFMGFNDVTNDRAENTASLTKSALQNANGNIGVNVAAGTNNQQANAAAIAKADGDSYFIVESANASAGAGQILLLNNVTNDGTDNDAFVKDNAMQNVSGNIGLNVVAGDVNQQKNDLAIAVVLHDGVAVASTSAGQASGGNTVDNDVATTGWWCWTHNTSTTNNASLSDNALQYASGNIGVNVAAGSLNQQYNGLSLASAQ